MHDVDAIGIVETTARVVSCHIEWTLHSGSSLHHFGCPLPSIPHTASFLTIAFGPHKTVLRSAGAVQSSAGALQRQLWQQLDIRR
jgi:hypothetical protein